MFSGFFLFSPFLKSRQKQQKITQNRESLSLVGIDGNHWIQKQRTKTGIKYYIPLLPIPKRIIAKYKEDPYCLQKGVLLPMLSKEEITS